MKTEKCLQCDQPYEARDLIPILPTTEAEKIVLAERMEALAALGLTHSLKKASGSGKKRKANGIVKVDSKLNPETSDTKGQTAEEANTAKITSEASRSTTSAPTVTNGIQNAATANLTAKVLQEEEARQKRRKMGENENLKSLFSKGSTQNQRNTDFMTRGFSIPAGAKHQ